VRVAYSFVIYLLASVQLCATDAFPAMRQFTIADGLPSLEVHCVFQDSRGKIWFGTDVGASCYDGVTFVNYTKRDSLPDHTIFGISEDRLGRIWFRSYNGLLSWFDGQKIVQPPVNKILLQRLKGRIVMSEELDDHDTLWIGLKNESGWIKIPPGFTQLIEAHVSNSLTVKEIRKGKLIAAATMNKTRFMFQSFGNAGREIEFDGENWPYAAACLAGGRYLVQLGYTCYIISQQTINVIKDTSRVSFIWPEKDGSYWLCGNRPGGARLMRRENGKEVLVKQYLRDYDVTGCIRDHEGGLWFSTLENGVFYIPFPEIQDVYALPLATGDHVTAMTSWPDGGTLMGTLRGSFFLANNDKCVPWNVNDNSISSTVNCMSTIGNSVFIGGTGASLIYNCSTKKIIAVENAEIGAPQLTLKCAMIYDQHHWCASSISSLLLINKETGKTEVLLKKLPERITSIARTRGDTLWLGGFTRLWMFIPGKDPVDWSMHYPQLAQQPDRLAGDTLNGRLWILSRSSGIFVLTASGVIEINREQPSLPVVCREMLLADGSLWIGTNAGVWELRMDADEKISLYKFDASNGLPANDVNRLCISGGRIWSSGNSMLFSFQPGKYPYNKIPPQVCFRKIFCNDHLLAYSNPEATEFHFNENTFRFQLAGQTYKSNGHPVFLVRLFGIDKWHRVEEPDITYYNLPPGDYQFVAYALNNSGVRSVAPIHYLFSVLPPFWKRSWFIAIICALIIFIIFALVRNYLQRFRREETYRRSLAELEITAIRAQMNPHFIFNAINSIYNFVLTGDRKTSASYVARFARLIRNVLEFASLKKITLDQELETLRLYMDIEQLRFREAFEYEITVDPQLIPASVQIVPMLLQPYVENAIWHGLSPKDGKGKLTISIMKEGDHLSCVIDDNGIGRAQAALTQHPGITKQPLSSKLNYRRLALLRELYKIGFDVKYIDKTLPETGTRVILHIPEILKP
jgi:ligand-binding sensor domain-containing protein